MLQAASAIETLNMNASPAKKIDFAAAATEHNTPSSVVAKPLVGLPDLSKYAVDEVDAATHSVASTLRPEEADEPLLRENPNRFVLFPIKFHEVRAPTRPHASPNLPHSRR